MSILFIVARSWLANRDLRLHGRQPGTQSGGHGCIALPGGEVGAAFLCFDRLVETAGFRVGRGKSGEGRTAP